MACQEAPFQIASRSIGKSAESRSFHSGRGCFRFDISADDAGE